MEEEQKENKYQIYKKRKSVQKSIYIPENLNEMVVKYQMEKEFTSYSEAIIYILKEFFKVEANKDNITVITEILRNVIRQELNSKFERQIALEVKSAKNGLASTYLLSKILASIFNTDEDTEFMRNAIHEANAIGYKAIKNYDIKNDFEKLANLQIKGEDV